MQTRKRAKSISFGRSKAKEETPAKKNEEEKPKHIATEDVEKKVEKAEVVERRPVAEKPTVESSHVDEEVKMEEPTAPAGIIKEPSSEEITPAHEFTATSPTPASEETSEVESEHPEPLATTPSDNLTTPVVEPEVTPPPPQAQVTEELSPTPPPSAFTLQNGNFDTPSDSGGKEKHFFLSFFVIALLAFILGLGAMAAVTYGLVKLPSSFSVPWLDSMTATPTATPTPKPSPTPEPTAKPVDASSYTITVLNGSGITGKAASVKASLETAGFKVTGTGNADRNDYTTTQISAKKNVDKAYLTSLEKELKKTFTVEEVSTIPSDASQKTDVVVTLGKAAAK